MMGDDGLSLRLTKVIHWRTRDWALGALSHDPNGLESRMLGPREGIRDSKIYCGLFVGSSCCWVQLREGPIVIVGLWIQVSGWVMLGKGVGG